MINPISIVNRLMNRNQSNTFLPELHSIISEPLFVSPKQGAAIINAYLKADPTAYRYDGEDDKTSSVNVTIQGDIAIIDISGALVAKEMNVPCAKSPVSYEALRFELGSVMNNSDIKTIVGRFNTPGGAASQNMDISDYIYSLRGKGKRLIAMIDDMSYSAGIAISSAFDEVWITRSGGTGSVGVVTYHVDQSEMDKSLGIKVEFIYAGDKKVQGNGHEPLTDEARSETQAEVDRLYTMFTETVARNFGMNVADVVATQAGTYHGQDAIDIGFAHKLGTFEELMESLMSEKVGVNTPENKPSGGNMLASAEAAKVEAAKVEAAKVEAAKVEAAKVEAAKVEAARESGIKALCATVGKPELAQDYIASGMHIESVQAALVSLTANENVTIQGASSNTEPTITTAQSWDSALS